VFSLTWWRIDYQWSNKSTRWSQRDWMRNSWIYLSESRHLKDKRTISSNSGSRRKYFCKIIKTKRRCLDKEGCWRSWLATRKWMSFRNHKFCSVYSKRTFINKTWVKWGQISTRTTWRFVKKFMSSSLKRRKEEKSKREIRSAISKIFINNVLTLR